MNEPFVMKDEQKNQLLVNEELPSDFIDFNDSQAINSATVKQSTFADTYRKQQNGYGLFSRLSIIPKGQSSTTTLLGLLNFVAYLIIVFCYVGLLVYHIYMMVRDGPSSRTGQYWTCVIIADGLGMSIGAFGVISLLICIRYSLARFYALAFFMMIFFCFSVYVLWIYTLGYLPWDEVNPMSPFIITIFSLTCFFSTCVFWCSFRLCYNIKKEEIDPLEEDSNNISRNYSNRHNDYNL